MTTVEATFLLNISLHLLVVEAKLNLIVLNDIVSVLSISNFADCLKLYCDVALLLLFWSEVCDEQRRDGLQPPSGSRREKPWRSRPVWRPECFLESESVFHACDSSCKIIIPNTCCFANNCTQRLAHRCITSRTDRL